MIRCTIHWTVHHCIQYCGKPAKYGFVMPKTDTIFPSCAEHGKSDLWLKEIGGKRYPIKKAIKIVESR